MRIVVVNLERASERRARMARQFGALGLNYEIKPAIDGRRLTAEQLALVDRKGRRRLGLYPQPDGSIACWLTYREVLRDLVDNGPDMMAIFQDDAQLAPALPDVLNALERQPFPFDVVLLHRRRPQRPFIPCVQLTSRHQAGRVRYSDDGAEGIVISRAAARHFIRTTPRMVLAIDHALLRFWRNGLNVFYVNPAVVRHGGYEDSYISTDRIAAKKHQREAEGLAAILWRRAVTGCHDAIMKRFAFRRLLRGEISAPR